LELVVLQAACVTKWAIMGLLCGIASLKPGVTVPLSHALLTPLAIPTVLAMSATVIPLGIQPTTFGALATWLHAGPAVQGIPVDAFRVKRLSLTTSQECGVTALM